MRKTVDYPLSQAARQVRGALAQEAGQVGEPHEDEVRPQAVLLGEEDIADLRRVVAKPSENQRSKVKFRR